MEKRTDIIDYLLPRLRDILFISIFIGVILLGPRTLNIDGDLGRHITVGNYILGQLTIPTEDIFSHTMKGQPLTPHEWLTQVAFAAAHHALGLTGVVILEAIIIALTFTLIYGDTLSRSESYLFAAGLTFWAAAASSLHWVARPHIFTFLFLALWTPLIRRTAKGQVLPIWIPPLIMVIWANSHGAFIAGFVVWGCYLLGWVIEYFSHNVKPSRHILFNLLIIGGLSFLVTLINPVGFHLWSTNVDYLRNSYLVNHTQEYLSPDFHNSGFLPFLVMLVFTIVLFSRGWRKLQIAEGLLIAGWAAMSLYSARNIPLFAIIAAPILGEYLRGASGNTAIVKKGDQLIGNIEIQLRGFLWPILFTACIVLLFISGKSMSILNQANILNPQVFPVAASDWLEENPIRGNVFNYFPWGGYLLYRFWPEQLVFIDGQTDFYGEKLTNEYGQVISAQNNWNEILEKYDVSWVIIPINSEFDKALDQDPTWIRKYKDNTSVIYTKR
jgi:hypothetical protein